jgi:hypothetical protein
MIADQWKAQTLDSRRRLRQSRQWQFIVRTQGEAAGASVPDDFLEWRVLSRNMSLGVKSLSTVQSPDHFQPRPAFVDAEERHAFGTPELGKSVERTVNQAVFLHLRSEQPGRFIQGSQ